jgi:hypothetical protein
MQRKENKTEVETIKSTREMRTSCRTLALSDLFGMVTRVALSNFRHAVILLGCTSRETVDTSLQAFVVKEREGEEEEIRKIGKGKIRYEKQNERKEDDGKNKN